MRFVLDFVLRGKQLFFTMFLMLSIQSLCLASDVALQWDANTEADLSGYKIYYDMFSGAPYNGEDADGGESPITIPVESLDDPDNPDFTVAGLDENETYFFAITAYDHEGLESDLSNEVSNAFMLSDDTADVLLADASQDAFGCFIKASYLAYPDWIQLFIILPLFIIGILRLSRAVTARKKIIA